MKEEKLKPYEIVAQKVIEILEDAKKKGVKYPFVHFFKDGAFNGVTGKVYARPENQFELGGEGEYLTFNQIKQKGGTLKKGSKAKKVYGYGIREVDKKDDQGNVIIGKDGKPEKETIARYKYSNVFDIKDTDLTPTLKQDNELDGDIDELVMDYIDMSGVEIEDRKMETHPRFDEKTNTIHCPKPTQFRNTSEYYACFLPLLLKSTKISGIDSPLASEIGASMIMGEFGIETPETRNNSTGIIQSYIDDISQNAYNVLKACNAANKAVRMIKREEA